MQSFAVFRSCYLYKCILYVLAMMLLQEAYSQQYTKVENVSGRLIITENVSSPFDSITRSRLQLKELPSRSSYNNNGLRDTIQSYGAINVTLITTGSNCNQFDGSVFATASGGVKPYLYSLDGGSIQRNGVFMGVKTGSHLLTVRDSTGTSVNIPVDIGGTLDPPIIGVDSMINNSGCLTSDGKIYLNATGGKPPYLFSQEDGAFQASNSFSNLMPGGYFFNVKDANGCTATLNSVNYGAFLTTGCGERYGIAYPHFACESQGYLGTVTMNASGTKPPYTFSLDGLNFQSSEIFTGLVPNQYKAYYKDGTGAIWWFRFRIREQCGTTVLSSSTDAACALSTGTLTANPIQGLPPYLFSLDGINYQSSPTFTNLAEGNYAILVKDKNGDIHSGFGYVNKLCPEVIASYSHPGCKNNEGVITAIPYKGTPPFSYSIDGILFQTSPIFSGLSAGNYVLSMKDSFGGIGTTPIELIRSCIGMNIRTDSSLCGKPNGSITVQAYDGIEPYQFSIDGGLHFQSQGYFDLLTPGKYILTVRDNSGKQSSEEVEVGNINNVKLVAATTPSNCNENIGIISLQATGGYQPYTYSIDSVLFVSNPTFSSLPSRTYSMYVKDIQGCIGTTVATVGIINTIDLKMGPDKTICESNSIELDPVSNASSYNWSPSLGLSNISSRNPIASPKVSTKYYVTATLGLCNKTDSMIVNVLPAPIPNAGKDQLICYGKDAVLSATGAAKYFWSPSTSLSDPFSSTATAKALTATQSYFLRVVDSDGCSSIIQDTVTVFVTPPVKPFIGNDTTILINQPFQLNVVDRNGSGFVSFLWTPTLGLSDATIKNPIVTISQNTKYVLSVKTVGGCEGSDDIYLKVIKGSDIYLPNAFTPNADGKNDLIRPILIGINAFKKFTIYNRWGQIVFSSSDASKGWDGSLNGVPLPTSSFTWIAEGLDVNNRIVIRKGVFTLVR